VWNNFLLSPIEAARYVDEMNAMVGGQPQVVGWYFDIGNIWASAWPRHWLDELGPERVLRLDIKGFSRAKADTEGRWAGFRVGIGDDDIPWDTVREWITHHRWQGWATAEVGGGDLAHLTDIARRLDAVLGLA
jgi:L-ribulose-5-phosphate 3-epimerase